MAIEAALGVGGGPSVLGTQPVEISFSCQADSEWFCGRSAFLALAPKSRPLLGLPEIKKPLTVGFIVIVRKANGFCPGAAAPVGDSQHPRPRSLITPIPERDARSHADKRRFPRDGQSKTTGPAFEKAVSDLPRHSRSTSALCTCVLFVSSVWVWTAAVKEDLQWTMGCLSLSFTMS